MYLSGTFLGLSSFLGYFLPSATPHTNIRFYGQITVDKVWGQNIELTDAQIAGFTNLGTYVPQWDAGTFMIADFVNDLSAGNLSGAGGSIISWDVFRKYEGGLLEKVVTIPYPTLNNIDKIISVIDFDVAPYKNVEYVVFGNTSTASYQPITSNTLQESEYGWFLIGDYAGQTRVAKFDLNLDFSGYTVEEDFTEHSTFLQYNVFKKGNRQFRRGTISALYMIPSNCEYTQTIADIDLIRGFLSDIGTKTLKSRKGEILRVKTHNVRINPLANEIGSQPYLMEFEFVESETFSDNHSFLDTYHYTEV